MRRHLELALANGFQPHDRRMFFDDVTSATMAAALPTVQATVADPVLEAGKFLVPLPVRKPFFIEDECEHSGDEDDSEDEEGEFDREFIDNEDFDDDPTFYMRMDNSSKVNISDIVL